MSVREAIMADRQQALRSMTEGTGFHYDWRNCYRWRAPNDFPEYPVCAILDVTEDVELLSYDLHTRTLSCEIHALHSVPYEQVDERDPASEAGSWMIADIERKMQEDVTCGGLAIDCRVTRNEKAVDTPAEPLVAVIVHIEIDYRTSRTDPNEEG